MHVHTKKIVDRPKKKKMMDGCMSIKSGRTHKKKKKKKDRCMSMKKKYSGTIKKN